MSDDTVHVENRKLAPIEKFMNAVYYVLDTPVTFFREKVVEPQRSKHTYYYYHRKFKRVPSIDQCEVGDTPCFVEAHEQFRRDRMVDTEILSILRHRREKCMAFEGNDWKHKCQKTIEDYMTAETNWFIKYGDLGIYGTVRDAYMKQKHRLIWERRHPPEEDEEY